MTARGRSQDRKRVAGGQDYEVRYEAKKTGEVEVARKSSRRWATAAGKSNANSAAEASPS